MTIGIVNKNKPYDQKKKSKLADNIDLLLPTVAINLQREKLAQYPHQIANLIGKIS